MTIKSVRFYYYPEDEKLKKALTFSHWGFAEWVNCRLKPIRQQLRGEEAKGVNIVNFMLFENPSNAWKLNEWGKRANSFEFDTIYDLKSLGISEPLENIKKLMGFAAQKARDAPWPQVRAVGEVLSQPLSDVEQHELLLFLRRPRGNT